MKMLIFLLGIGACLHGQEGYLSMIEKIEAPNGDFKRGEIEIVVEPETVALIEKVQKERLLKKGYSLEKATEYSRTGIVAEDHYWVWLRDAVYFPGQVAGTYDRIVWKADPLKGPPGVAVLPILPNGKIVLNLNFRHATRSWEIEVPRGGKKAGETDIETAQRELKEETGLEVEEVIFLGNMAPDSGALSSVIPVYLGVAGKQGMSNQDYSEAISKNAAFTKKELKKGILQGYLSVELNGNKVKVPFRDSFFTFAFLQADLRGHL